MWEANEESAGLAYSYAAGCEGRAGCLDLALKGLEALYD